MYVAMFAPVMRAFLALSLIIGSLAVPTAHGVVSPEPSLEFSSQSPNSTKLLPNAQSSLGRIELPPALSRDIVVKRLPAQEQGAEQSLPSSSMGLGIPVFLRNARTDDERLFLLQEDGQLVGEDLAAMTEFMACRRSGRSHAMSPRVLSILAEIAQEYPGHTIEIVSGFRRRGFGVKGSKHYRGRAIDLRVEGVPTHKVRDFVWGFEREEMGVGHYRHEDFIHVDYRENESRTAWTQRRRNSPYHYNPRWARKDREEARVAHASVGKSSKRLARK